MQMGRFPGEGLIPATGLRLVADHPSCYDVASGQGGDWGKSAAKKRRAYVKRFSRYKNPDAVRQVRDMLSRYGLAEFELCTLGPATDHLVGLWHGAATEER
ncbi:hypothetical protein GUJ93_ZPchr0006g43389 [Zizania palustris]|uniref:Uncharacterized protein n=1 Tax=Zizania palustris TaxID=103762 RepID=A0A8J5VQ54_ZIZPA|nr:hypothetical protein GUJ93_ZPchr0006g43389 [Zizania palustris]